MPTWAAILIGVVSGLGSGTLGTLLSIAHQRGAELRTRRLDAAAAFLESADLVRRGLRQIETVDVVDAKWEDLFYRAQTIELLFGRASPVTLFAKTAAAMFGRSIATIKQAAELEQNDRATFADAAQRDIDAARDAIGNFTAASTDAWRDGWIRERFRPRRAIDYISTGPGMAITTAKQRSAAI